MVKIKGYISPLRAAEIIEVHVNTIYRWCEMAHDTPPVGPLVGVCYRDETRHWWIEKRALEERSPLQ